MKSPRTIRDLIAKANVNDPAIKAPDRTPMSYGALKRLADTTGKALAERGIGGADRVAIVLPNGPEMAAAFIAVAANAVTAPLNPAYTADELKFFLTDLNARAIIVSDLDGPAVSVARELGVGILTLTPDENEAAGMFSLSGDPVGEAVTQQDPTPQSIALMLHTSGTTSRPKLVPLTQANICASAHNICQTLELTPHDTCLNVMPLFHIHGLIAATLSSLAGRGSVFCTTGFNALKFFGWLRNSEASWYTAVPTMHQAILSRADRNRDLVKGLNLRFVRSSSASLPPAVMFVLEKAFNAPVIESYGMTEAAHQMASNPLPPKPQKAGTVGLSAGPAMAIMNDAGAILTPGQTGEVAIMGENVMAAYENNVAANADAFFGSWFRTGDQGYLDDDGYLVITGRLKEIINRGGEKISPREVDEVLIDHPAVAQAVTFAILHEKLGDDIGAAIVLNDGATATETEIREFVGEKLAPFKVPRKIVFLDDIPKGPTGKLQRIGLAAVLGLEPKPRVEEKSGPEEKPGA